MAGLAHDRSPPRGVRNARRRPVHALPGLSCLARHPRFEGMQRQFTVPSPRVCGGCLRRNEGGVENLSLGPGVCSPAPFLKPLEDNRDALPATDTHGGQAVAALYPVQLVDTLGRDNRPRGTHRMAKRNSPAVDIHLGGL